MVGWSILEINLLLNYLSCFASGPILPRKIRRIHTSIQYRGNGPSTRCAFTSGCAGTGRANINQWSQEWNQGGRVVPHNAATGEVRERCTPCLVSVSMLLSTHAQAHVHARTRHPYSYVQSWRCIVHATASPSHAITWETNKRIHRCSRTHTLGGE